MLPLTLESDSISDSEEHRLNEKEVIVYSDAAFAPMRAFERRSISGAVLIYRQVTLKCFSRHQHAVSLSSCEAELHALQAAVQEAIGLARTLAFVLKSLKLRKDLPARRGRVSSSNSTPNRFFVREAVAREL